MFSKTKEISGKTLAIMLMASMLVSANSLNVVAYNASQHSFGVVGGFTEWGGAPDYVMTDDDGDGIYYAHIKGISSGSYEFKVRADMSWEDSWGEYEPEYDRTYNSQTNFVVEISSGDVLTVKFDTTGDDEIIWPVTWYIGDYEEESVEVQTTEDGFVYIETDDGVLITKYTGTVADLVIPDSINNKPVTSLSTAVFKSSNIKSIVWPESITEIPSNAFYGCNNLKSVTIPETVTSIGEGAFYNCSSLQEIVIPSGVVSIGKSAFSYCSSLKSIDIPATVTSIGDNAFYYCSALTEISVPSGVTSINNYTFYKCSKLQSVTLPENLESIGTNAFYDCDSLKSIELPDNLEDIGRYAFYSCNSLESISIPSGVTELYYDTFAYCKSLKEVVIPDTVESVGDSVFYECTALETVKIGKGLSTLSSYAFSGCTSLKSFTVDSGNRYYTSVDDVLLNKNKTTLICYPVCKESEEYEIPNTVTEIRYSTFSNCKNLKSVFIPASVTEIGEYAFYNCTGLEEITIPNSVTSMGDNTFENCSSLKKVVIGKNLSSIGYETFNGCKSLSEIQFGKSVTSIASYAFSNCTSLTSFTIPDTVTSVGSSIFYNCTNLTSVTFGKGMTNIGSQMFGSCEKLESVILSENIKNISGDAFSGCSKLANISVDENNKYFSSEDGVLFNTDKTKLVMYPIAKSAENYVIPSTVTEISNYTFSGCQSLTSITVPDSVKKIGNYAFSNCSKLKSAVLPKNVDSMGYSVFRYCSSLETVKLPENLTSIPESTFYNCSKLKEIKIPATVKSVEDYAFYCCNSLTQVVIPDGVQSLEYECFEDCYNLEIIIIPASVTSIGSYVFYDCYNLTIYGYADSKAEEYAKNVGRKFVEFSELENFSFAYSDKVMLGETVNLRALSDGGIGTKQYTFLYKKTADKSWITISKFGKTKTASFKPDKVGSYDVCIKVQDGMGTIVKKYITIDVLSTLANTSSVSSEKIDPNKSVTLEAAGTGGTGFYQYAYYYKKSSASAWKTISNFTAATSKKFTPTETGIYDICIKVKDSMGTVSKKYMTLTVGNILLNNSTLSAETISLGETITANAVAEGGSGSYQYAVYYKKTSDTKWTTGQNYASNNTVTVKPAKATTYDVCVKVKDNQNNEVKKFFTVTVK